MKERVIYHKLLTPEEALGALEKSLSIQTLGVEKVSLDRAFGRVLAEDVYASIDVPHFDRSTVDGYALRAEDTFGASELSPVELRVVGSVSPGRRAEIRVGRGEAVEISTGAFLPAGANAVAMVEFTKRIGEKVMLYRPTVPGENVLSAGGDIAAGELVLRRCTKLGEREVGVLAALGVREVQVFRKPRVAVISTGDELVPPGEPLSIGKIYDINSYSIYSSLLKLGAEPHLLGIVKDDMDEMRRKVREAEAQYDMVIVSGGTSAGPTDMIYKVFAEMGPPGVIVHGLKVKPGKPTVLAVSRSGKALVGLPGYPSSALMIFSLIVKPIVLKMLCQEEREQRLKARLAVRAEGARGRRGLYPVSLIDTGKGVVAYPLSAESGAIKVLAQADGFLQVPETTEYLPEGEEVEVTLFSHEYSPAELYIVGSHDVALDRLVSLSGIRAKTINVGSLEGMRSAVRGEADVAGLHIVDEESGEYNVPILEKYGAKGVVLVRGYLREQGLLVPRGNPMEIKGIEDLLRLRIVNRNKGSGTRFLLDSKLKELARKRGASLEELTSSIEGYSYEVRTHTAVAAAVSQGKADVGVAIRAAAEIYGLDFVSLGWERYDFLVPREKLEKGAVKRFLSHLRSERFREELGRLGGYRADPLMGEIVREF
ncbi:MAG: molybdopterin biosynthesis protein [Acidilobaceae archaeon]|nr:molybdopterin biosynthesis protein [Acidilobaceae archaeon]MCX8165045.1 molybdopterin biosynthesis protein [Acidilobaceae archaeon]MDW7974438.1 molybdopterin biosynthesis protein [Sulfolobales archaeon]